MIPVKNHEFLLQMFFQVKRELPDAALLCAGRGELEESLKARACELGLEDAVRFLGVVDDVPRLLRAADAFVFPSVNEGLALSAVEAQASGTPLIISDIPGLMEACDGGHTAVVTPRRDPAALADALEALADDPARRARMGAEGRAYVERAYEVGACFDRVEEIYRRNMEEAR